MYHTRFIYDEKDHWKDERKDRRREGRKEGKKVSARQRDKGKKQCKTMS